MYAILSGGALVSLCDAPRYVKKNGNGVYVRAAKEDAEGIAVSGTLYNLPGGTAVGDAPEAIVKDSEAGEYVFSNRMKIEENEEANEAAIITVEDSVCELDVSTDARMTAIEDALCELDALTTE